MLRTFSHLLFALLAITSLTLGGCGAPAAKTDKPAKGREHKDEHADHAEHGPHEGALIELGEEEYHAELVHDDATHTVVIYLLDNTAKKPVTSDDTEVIINVAVDGAPQEFKLPANPQDGDAAGKSSSYKLTSEPLCKALDSEKVKGRLSVKLGEKAFSGDLPAHSHEHDHK